MQKTLYPEINMLLEDLRVQIHAILGEKLVGLYLYGSLTWGDFDYESSDIDLLVATATDINKQEFDELDKAHSLLAQKYKHAREGMLEIAYISVNALQTFKTQRSQIAIISPGEPFHFKDAGNDWLINWYSIREKSVVLFGTSPQTFIASISQEEFIQAVQEQTKDWRDWIDQISHHRPSQAYAILTMCRALYACKNGEQVSKKQAAAWVEKQFPEWSSLIENALQWRMEWRNKDLNFEETFPETKKFVNFVIDHVVEKSV